MSAPDRVGRAVPALTEGSGRPRDEVAARCHDNDRSHAMTRTRILVLSAIALIALAGCGKADDPGAPPSRNAQAIVDMCVADGGAQADCECTAKALERTVDEPTLGLVVDFAKGMTGDGSKESKGMVALGAIGDPKLMLAMEKLGQAAKACEREAAIEAARLQVAAAEAAAQARRPRAAARQCPHAVALPPAAPGAPVDDVVGLRPGMGFDDVEAVLECAGEALHFDVEPSWARANHGLPTRQLLRAADGEVCPAELRVDDPKACDDGGYGFAPLRGVTREVIVAFAGMPGAERAGVIWRRTAFADGKQPTVSSLQEALVQKYGPPHLLAKEEGYYSLGHRRGTLVLSWVHDARQRPIARGDSARRSRCVNGPRPTLRNRMSWNGACGLTVRAEIVPASDNRILARELNVVVMDQKRFNDDVKRFEADIKAAVEAQHGRTGTKPTL
jgi:hypothetical protein